jgi:hypothetical protein
MRAARYQQTAGTGTPMMGTSALSKLKLVVSRAIRSFHKNAYILSCLVARLVL